MNDKKITILGANEHNLKNIDVSIPHNSLTVITGLSGSGKSSLAFDTIYAEGQRRYIETFSAYARQFIGNLKRPNVEKIDGLCPVIAIEQKTVSRNPRSTVGTITEIYDYLRLLFARVSEPYSYETGEKMVKYNEEQIKELILRQYQDHSIYILSPIVRGRKGHYQELFEQLRNKGFLYVRVDGKFVLLKPGLKLDRYNVHFIELLIDQLTVTNKNINRLNKSLTLALKHGNGTCLIIDESTNNERFFSKHFMCPTTGLSYNDPAPHTFSFNSPQGACPYCNGLGVVNHIDEKKIIPDKNISIAAGGILPIGKYHVSMLFNQLEAIAAHHGFSLKTPIKDLPKDILQIILYGSPESYKLKKNDFFYDFFQWEGIVNYIMQQHQDPSSSKARKWSEEYVETSICPECKGYRLKKESLHYKIHDKNIGELASMNLDVLYDWINNVEAFLNPKQQKIASEILKEIRHRLKFILDVGINYLSLNRPAQSLSGGESQRIRLATQIGSQLVNVLYILDEPSIGLHQRDNTKLIQSLKQLRDIGNTIIVVEHDKQIIESADYIVDMGPGAGKHGGRIVAQGTVKEILTQKSLTADYLNGYKFIPVPNYRREGNKKYIRLIGATGNNLKNITVTFPLGTFICVTGVSGSGKSSLIRETLYPILSQHFYRSLKKPLPYKSIEGIENIDKVIEVDQSPIGRTPRSNIATYTNIFNDIRNLFAQMPLAKVRGYKAGRFSFNIKGGRCEACGGSGLKTIEMNFLPDVFVECPECNGKRYNRETLEVRYKGKSISDVLDLTVEQALEFFENIPAIHTKLKALYDVGLGYISLGQPATTLSGGEAQRVKLASEFTKRDTGNTLYILDEPTTGLHFEDIRILLQLLQRLVDKGNTIIVIEHNLDVIKQADYIIDLGPDGGENGGYIVAEGTPEYIADLDKGFTAQYLKKELNFSNLLT
ncbi:MAG: excinuclease ABC subunit UvrA [Bacteroidales bacterium]